MIKIVKYSVYINVWTLITSLNCSGGIPEPSTIPAFTEQSAAYWQRKQKRGGICPISDCFVQRTDTIKVNIV